MYDFLSFIDSNAIREYNKDREFTLAEQAVIVSRSFKRTLDEKIAALEYLYNTFGEDEFTYDWVGCLFREHEVPFHTKLGDYISGIKKSLDDRKLTDGYVYNAGCYESGEKRASDIFFSDYERAYKYIKEIYELSPKSHNTKYVYWISRIRLDREFHNDIINYEFDKDLRLIFAGQYPPCETDEFSLYDFNVSEHFVDMPLPFKRGELLKDIYPFYRNKYPYYVSTGRYKDPIRTAKKLRHGDYRNMCVCVYSFEPDTFHKYGGLYDDHTHIYSLHLDYCDEQDIERIDKGTKYLAAAMDEECDYDMMNLMCDYGNDWRYSRLDIDGYIRNKLCSADGHST